MDNNNPSFSDFFKYSIFFIVALLLAIISIYLGDIPRSQLLYFSFFVIGVFLSLSFVFLRIYLFINKIKEPQKKNLHLTFSFSGGNYSFILKNKEFWKPYIFIGDVKIFGKDSREIDWVSKNFSSNQIKVNRKQVLILFSLCYDPVMKEYFITNLDNKNIYCKEFQGGYHFIVILNYGFNWFSSSLVKRYEIDLCFCDGGVIQDISIKNFD